MPPGVSAGTNLVGSEVSTQSRATKIVKCWIPGKKFYRSGKIVYESGTAQPKFFEFRAFLFAYSNYTTLQDQWNVGRVNDYIREMYYKDA